MIIVRNALCLLLAGALVSIGTPRVAFAGSPDVRPEAAHAQPQAALAVRLELERLGVTRAEAELRVAALDDAELAALAGKLDEQPAGQGAFETALIAAGAVFILLVILDATGVTDIFPWINKPKR